MFGSEIGRWLALLALVGFAQPIATQAQPWQQGQGPGFGQWHDPAGQWQRELAHASGFLIVDGVDIPLPCRMLIEGDQLKINDKVVTSNLNFGNSGQKGGGKANDSKSNRSKSRNSQPAPARIAAIGLGHTIAQSLGAGHLVVALSDQPLLVLSDGLTQHEMLRILGSTDQVRVTPASLGQHLPPGADPETWDAWIASFTPSATFRERALAAVEQYDRIEAENFASIAATRRLNTFSYPLSILGMVATTLGIGHLLSHRPPVDAKSLETDASPLAIRVLTYSLGLVIIYSTIDLTWTILAHQAGQMIELNPIGSQLVDNPLQLIAFKSAATGLAVGLLFVLRKYRKAQLAAWWVCLICTLLTARWLTMSHMFAA